MSHTAHHDDPLVTSVSKPAIHHQESIHEQTGSMKALGLPDVGVSFRNLSYSMMLSAAQSSHEIESVYQKYFEIATLPLQIVKKIAAVVTGHANTQTELKILENIDGHLSPGKMTLLLSPPGHGKTSYLRALASQLPRTPLSTGEVRYGGLTADELLAKGIHSNHMVQYVGQLDQHLPFLTVRETFEFIHANALVDPAEHGHVELGEAHTTRVQDTLELLSLKNCADTVVGNDLLRGISGGEKKRVTVGEGLLTNARVLLMDEITTGLDASVSFDIIHSLRRRAQRDNLVVVAALLQPTPEVYAQFDEIILLREGQVLYHGPRTELPGYLKSLGFEVPTTKTLAAAAAQQTGAVQSQTTASGHQSHHHDLDMADFLSEFVFMPHKGLPEAGLSDQDVCPPLTSSELAAAWKSNPLYQQQMSIDDTQIELKSSFAQAQYGQQHVLSTLKHVGSLIKRQFLLLSRNKVFLTFRTISSCVISVIFGGMYYQKSTTIQADVLARYGLFLNTLLQLSFTNMSEMATNVEFKFCAYKHVASNTFPRFAYVLAAQLAHIPIAIVETLIAGSILYWMSGLAPYASNWIFFVLLGFLANVFMGAMFRTFAYAMPTLQAAQSAPMPLISILILFAGFMISQSHMGWTLIFFYIDIYGWLYRAMAQNEFLSPAFEFTAPRFGNSTAAPVPMGHIYLQMFDIQTDPVWMGYGVLHACVSIVIVVVCSFLAFSYIQYDRNIGSARRIAEPDDELLARLGSKGGPKAGQEIALQMKSAAGTEKSSAAHSRLADHVSKKVDTRSSLPFTPISVTFSDLKYTITLPDGKEKCILQGISGCAAPGRLCSLMGASGSGKTTLLDVLASRKNNGKIEGKMLLNGFPKDEGVFSRLAAYVEQQDIHMPLTTVREALQFSAAMRLPSEVTEVQREAFIDEVLLILELGDIQDRKVGEIGAADALAPGERKRLTIAVELVSNSPVIFLDEPTSGLDARAAAVVMRVIKNVADTGRTVICTIHQPSSDLFFMFDDLLLLQKGGYMVYFGPLGEGASAFVEYLEGMDGVKPCPPNFNPASWMLDVMANTDSSIAADDSAVEPEHRVVHTAIPGPVLASRFVESPQWKSTSAVMARLAVPVDGSKPVSFDSQQVRTWFEQFVMLVQRTQRSYSRNIGFNGARVNSAIVLMLLYGVVYFDKSSEAVNVSGVSSLVACIFMTATFFGMLNMQASIPDLVKNRATFYREQAAHMYDPFAYSLANITVEVPWTACIMLAVLPIVYFMLGLSSDVGTFFSHYIISFALALVFISIGHLMAAAMPSYEVAMSAAGAIAPLTFLFGGMFAPVPSMPAGARWVASIDPVYYTFQALIPIHFWCDASVPGVHCPTIPVPSVTSAGGVIVMDRYKYVTKTYDMTYDAHWTNFGYIWIFFFVLQLGTMLNIKYRRYIIR